MNRITITIEPQVFDNLPKRDRSAYINLVLKQHFQSQGIDKLYLHIKQKLLSDDEFKQQLNNPPDELLYTPVY